MDNSNFIDFFAEEAARMYKELHIKTMQQYRELYIQEEKIYVNSSEYKRIKNKEYWSRPKAEIMQEQLEEEKAKLGYWVPHIAPSDTHITYQKKAMRDSSNTSNYDTPTGFNPSISPEEYFENQKNAILAMTQNPIITSIVKEFAYKKFKWERTEDFDSVCTEFVATSQDAVCDFLGDLEVIDSNIGFKRKLQEVSDSAVSCPACGCEVAAQPQEERKPIKFKEIVETEKRLLICEQHENFERTNIDFNQLETIEFEVTDSLYDIQHILVISNDVDNETVLCRLKILESKLAKDSIFTIDKYAKDSIFFIEESDWKNFLKELLIEIDILNMSQDEFESDDKDYSLLDELSYKLTIQYGGKRFEYSGGTTSNGVEKTKGLFETYFTPPKDVDYFHYKTENYKWKYLYHDKKPPQW